MYLYLNICLTKSINAHAVAFTTAIHTATDFRLGKMVVVTFHMQKALAFAFIPAFWWRKMVSKIDTYRNQPQ